MSLRALRFAFTLTMALPTFVPTFAPSQATARPRAGRRVKAPDPLRKWATSGYHYCDAKILAGLWHSDTYAAKRTVGKRLLAGDFRGVERDLGRARKMARRKPGMACTYHQAGYSYRDAEQLAGLWHVSVAQAKKQIANKVLAGGDDAVRGALRQAQGARRAATRGHAAPPRSPAEAQATFFKTGYTYCDAKALGAMWQGGVTQAKELGGYILLGGGRKTLDGTLFSARKLATRTGKGRCSFSDAGFTARDAQTLARMWRVSPKQARARAERKISWGAERDLRRMVRRGGR